jgi:hypothetical protein
MARLTLRKIAGHFNDSGCEAVHQSGDHADEGSRGGDLLIVIAPGIERFEYFRRLSRVMRGEEPPASLREVQELYDMYFLESPEWKTRR